MIFGIFDNSQEKDDASQAASGTSLELQIEGMHCTSCSMNIDGELEDTEGVIEARTSYAQSRTEVAYDPEQISPGEIKRIISELGYEVSVQD